MGSGADSLAMSPSPPKKGIDVPSSLPMRMPQAPWELEPPMSLFPPEAKPRGPRRSKWEAMADESLDLGCGPTLCCTPSSPRRQGTVPVHQGGSEALLLGAAPEPCSLEVRWVVPSPLRRGRGRGRTPCSFCSDPAGALAVPTSRFRLPTCPVLPMWAKWADFS